MDEIHLVQIDSIPCHIPTTPKYYLLRNLFWFMVFKGPFLGFNVIIHNTTRTTALSVASLPFSLFRRPASRMPHAIWAKRELYLLRNLDHCMHQQFTLIYHFIF